MEGGAAPQGGSRESSRPSSQELPQQTAPAAANSAAPEENEDPIMTKIRKLHSDADDLGRLWFFFRMKHLFYKAKLARTFLICCIKVCFKDNLNLSKEAEQLIITFLASHLLSTIYLSIYPSSNYLSIHLSI